jgi:hypothetical protein
MKESGGDLKIEELEVQCSDSTALPYGTSLHDLNTVRVFCKSGHC